MATISSKKLLPSRSSGGAITETQKPFLVPVSNILYKKDVNISQKLLKPADKETQGPGGSLLVIKKKVLKIEDVIGSTYLIQQSENNRKRKEKERQKTEEREKKLETKPGGKVDFGNLPKVSLPGGSILDTIKRFIAFTFAGFLFDKYNQYLPKLLEFGKYIAPVTKFIDAFSKNVVDGVIKFIDLGYQTYDNVRKKIDDIGGKDAVKQFDKFSGELNKLLNGAIMASMLIASTAPRTPGGAAGGTGAGASRSLGMGMTPKPISGFGGGTAMTPGRYRTPGQASARGFGLEQARKGLTFEQSVAARKAAQSTATQGAKGAARLGIARVPIIGALIGFIVDTVVFREKPSRAAAGAVGSAVGQGIGLALAGGTTFGLGAGVGLFVGGFLGDIVGKSLYDAFAGYQPQPTPAKAQGGQVGSGQSRVSPTRKIKTQKTTTRKTYTPSKVQPGRDVGGKLRIEGLYGKDEPGQRSALRALVKSSADLKKMRSLNGVAGGMLGAGVDMALGQKPDRKLANSLGNMFGSVVEAAINAELNSSFNDISKSIAMANGGVVPSREIGSGMNIGERIGRYISNAFSIALESSAAKVLQNLNQELNLQGIFGETPYDKSLPSGEMMEYEVKGGELPSSYSGRGAESHGYPGRDYQIEVGKAISVFKPGTVVYARLNPSGYGNLVIIRHKDGKQSVYAHLSKINVREGDEIKEGEKKVIGLTGGATGTPGAGNSTGPHLHFEVRDSRGNKITGYNDGDAYFRFGTVTGIRKRTPLEMSKLPVEPTGQQLQGEISWYGPGFYGNKTANGETYTGNEMTAAHKSLPFGSLVRVTWQGRSIVVRINDRGPYISGRVLDLSRAAASALGMSGVARGAKIEIVKPKTTASPPAQLGKIISSTNIDGNTYTVREDGKYYKNGKPITEAEYDKALGLQLSLAPSQPSRDIASLQTDTPYTVVHEVKNIVMPLMVG